MKLNEKMIFFGAAALIFFLAALFIYMKQGRQAKEAAEIRIDTIEDVKGLGYSGQRKIVADNGGNFFVAYRKKYQGKSEIFVAKAAYLPRRPASPNRGEQAGAKGQWKISGTNQPISQVGSGVDQRVPSIAVDQENNLHVVWYGSDLQEQPNNRQVKYSRSSDGGKTWTQWKNISPVTGYASQEDYWQEHPHILSGAGNKLFVVWEGKDQDNQAQQIKFSRSADGGATWSQWTNVQASQGNTQSRPTLVEDRSGRLHLFMYSSNGNNDGRQQIQYLWSDDEGNSWSERLAVSDPNSDSRHVSAVSDAAGKIYVVWRTQTAQELSRIMYLSWEKGNWSAIRPVASSERYQFFPSIGVDESGEINVVWMESGQSSDLPAEDPRNGKVYSASLNSETFSDPKILDALSSGLYPNIAEKFRAGEAPVIYELTTDSGNYNLIFRLLK